MKVLVLGAGATGGHYGGRLLQAGADLTFLVRSARAQQLREHGLVREGHKEWPRTYVKTVLEVAGADAFDIVVLTCKSYDLEAAMAAIAPVVDANAVVLPLLNGLMAYEALDKRFGIDRVLGGVAYVDVTLGSNGAILQRGSLDTLLIGARSTAASRLAAELASMLPNASGPQTLTTEISQQLWSKWVMLAAGAVVTCLMRGTVGQILQQAGGASIVRQAISECLAVAVASGHALGGDAVAGIERRLLDTHSNWAPSILRDVALGASRVEADAIVGDMFRKAVAVGQVPELLRLANCNLRVYEAQRTAAQR